ncbi:hypothetical protein QBZ16_004930 [Prototheca wickerhamii]|uniref:Fungal lipase-type domain-containing protein n=1 Tax=Prototheca wickerhamii TaxID=3111 RepID=A0AAD9MMP3_PROWI|nr:hypothetical protein QBZ16_004930 [Prototheca wickerhamii]
MASLDLFCCGLVPCTTVASCVCGGSEEVAVADWDQDIGKGAEPSALWNHAPARTPKETAPRSNQKKPVVLLLESVTRNEALGFQVTVVATTLLIWAYIIGMLVIKINTVDDNHAAKQLTEQLAWIKVQLIIAAVCTAVLAYMMLLLVWRLARVRRRGTQGWTQRRKMLVADGVVLTLVQLFLSVASLASAAYFIANACAWFSSVLNVLAFLHELALDALLSWMCIMVRAMTPARATWRILPPDEGADAAGRRARANPKLLFDMPWRTQLLAQSPINWGDLRDLDCSLPTDLTCDMSGVEVVATALGAALLILFSLVYCWLLFIARRGLAKLPYYEFRLPKLYLKMHVAHGLFVMGFLAPMSAALSLIELNSCWSFASRQFGDAPIQIAVTVLVVVFGLLLMPRKDDVDHVLKDWSTEFAWTEVAMHETLRERRRLLASESNFERANAVPDFVPHFLTDTALAAKARRLLHGLAVDQPEDTCTLIKLFYFSHLVYRIGLGDANMSPENALGLYPGLERWELLEEPESRHARAAGLGPRHHRPPGGLQGFDERLLDRVDELLKLAEGGDGSEEQPPTPRPPAKLFVTGHSLGGALAILAAADIRRRHPDLPMTVYTYGAPRVGNLGFVQEYLRRVPDTWAVVNDQDPIPRIPKGWFHNAGNCVVINGRGDLIIRPSEFDLISISRAGGVALHHKLYGYALSVYAILQAQFDDYKAVPEGDVGVVALSQRVNIIETLTLVVGSQADEEAPAPKDVSKQVVLDDDDALEEDGLDQVALELDDTGPGPLQRLSTVAPAEKAP